MTFSGLEIKLLKLPDISRTVGTLWFMDLGKHTSNISLIKKRTKAKKRTKTEKVRLTAHSAGLLLTNKVCHEIKLILSQPELWQLLYSVQAHFYHQ